MQLLLCKTCTSFIKCTPSIIHQSQEPRQQQQWQLCPSQIGPDRTTAGAESQSGPWGVSPHVWPICEADRKQKKPGCRDPVHSTRFWFTSGCLWLPLIVCPL